ncbi:MAG: N-6 DNA methylase [Oscillospiraceae bacterium]|nr:N-6 DNA methylase [Oscillospiraceae bacterium]
MRRTDIITTVGSDFLTDNIENGEFSYEKALKEIGKDYLSFLASDALRRYKNLDLRFANERVTVLIETKSKLVKGSAAKDIQQLQQYVTYEKQLTDNRIVAILAATQTDEIRVWLDDSGIIDEEHENKSERVIRPFTDYEDVFFGARNDKRTVVENTYALNELLHGYGINEKIRSQFVGTCLLALKNGLKYEGLSTKQIRVGVEEILNTLLDKAKDLNKAAKLVILKSKVIDSQDVTDLTKEQFSHVLQEIKNKILPFINERTTKGQDLLNLFFTTFNKYVGKADKNQAFTPDHIVHFMCKVVGVNRNSVILDPCCGSGAFLVRAMTEALADCDTENERERVKKKQIFGIEYEETAFGLATTNMLIHSDGNSNIVQGSCFKVDNYVDAGINVVLMNPPYNAQRKHSDETYAKTWNSKLKEDPSKGFHYVYKIAEKVKTGRLAVLLPMQCAIGTDADIKLYKSKMLEKHTLDAVFSFPSDMFHPGASANACCMVFTLGTRHENATTSTFFGYFRDDGFVKRKNLGRIEKTDDKGLGVWANIEANWLRLYRGRKTEPGLSVCRKVIATDEWLAEAYMETDYSVLSSEDFLNIRNKYLSYVIYNGGWDYMRDFIAPATLIEANDKISRINNFSGVPLSVDITSWKYFPISGKSGIFKIEPCKCSNASEFLEDGDDIDYIGAKKDNNGVMRRVKNNEELTTKGNCIVFICDGQGSVGYTNYIEKDFIGSTTLSVGRNINLNRYNALFLVAVLDLERYRYSFGRKYKTNLSKAKILLPAKENAPDWDYMESYIKSLPYRDKL